MAFLVCVFGWFWVGFVFLFFMVASNWRTHAVPAGALAFVRWAAGGYGQQCVVSGFSSFILFRFPELSRPVFIFLFPATKTGRCGRIALSGLPYGAGSFFSVPCSYRDAGCPVCLFYGCICHEGGAVRAHSPL